MYVIHNRSARIPCKWEGHLEEESELKISRLWSCDRMVAMSTVIEKEMAWRSWLGLLKWKARLLSTQKEKKRRG